MQVLQTDRLTLSHLGDADVDFIMELLNDPSFVRYIGDKGVRTVADAREYLRTGPVDSYQQHGYGLFRMALSDSDVPIGICGLLKRDYLGDPDVGFALLPAYCSKGYAVEAAAAVLDWGRNELGLRRIVAIVDKRNERSIALIEKIGLHFEKTIRVEGEEQDVSLYAVEYA